MTDQLVRAAFHLSVLQAAHCCTDNLVIDELGLHNGEIRADIAVLGDKLTGYEIKTSKDRLIRLPRQVSTYSQIFEEAFLVVAEKHLKSAIDIIPSWWGIYIIDSNNDTITFDYYRPSDINPNRDFISIAQLLWKNEALDIANHKFNCNVKEKSSRCVIYESLSKVCSIEEISYIVIDCLKRRDAWRQYQSIPFQSDDCCLPNSKHLVPPALLLHSQLSPNEDLPWRILPPYNRLSP